MKLIVLRGDNVNLVGRSWLNELKLSWEEIIKQPAREATANMIRDDREDQVERKIGDLKEKYAELFSGKLGKVKDFKASLNVKNDAQPKFMKARPVPYAMRDAVEKEIERLETEGVLKPIPISEWASPVVIIRRPDGRIRMCAVIENEEYPMPTAEELFNKMQGDEKFSKIDLSNAYLQVELEQDSQKLCVINTCKGLRQPTRLLNGVKPASGMFQQLMESKLQHVSRTVVKIDDILTMGVGDIDHLKNLEDILETLSNTASIT